MRQAPEHLRKLIEPVVEGLGYDCAGIEFLPQGRHSLLRVYIDLLGGIGVADCERVSRQLSALLDVEDPIKGEYTLEVSSPGADRLLFSEAQFSRFIGRQIKIKFDRLIDERRNLVATLTSVDPGKITVVEADRCWEVNLEDVISARVVPELDFKGGGKKQHSP